MPPGPLPVLIAGAGVCGLTLAQHLRRCGVPFHIFDRDASINSRTSGWGLTFHWALPILRDLLPPDIFALLEEASVNRDATSKGDMGRYHFFDLRSGIDLYDLPAGARIRVSRGKLRSILATNVDVEWSKKVTDVESTDDAVVVRFEDGTSRQGCLLVGCDGSRSRVRQLIYPSTYQNRPVPVQLVGAAARYSAGQMAAARAIDPYFFQGSHPEWNVYLWFSYLETPEHAQATSDDYFCQIVVSWPEEKDIRIPTANAERITLMKRLTSDWAEPFRSLIQNLPNDADVISIDMEDWLPEEGAHGKGCITLMGDAAHTMTMFRGEGANTAVADIRDFMKRLGSHLPGDVQRSGDSAHGSGCPSDSLRKCLDAYEDDVFARAQPCVLGSRQACLDAHNFARIKDGSSFVARRLKQAQEEQAAKKL
ncbi:hypothetical protein VTN00DRAFT_6604 [Thermoascus crustaceus]|uniref:uncharacterized protein n=1 Tax=Thermoascus crustaceus TaxID=5088 RepID=UPI00374270AA